MHYCLTPPITDSHHRMWGGSRPTAGRGTWDGGESGAMPRWHLGTSVWRWVGQWQWQCSCGLSTTELPGNWCVELPVVDLVNPLPTIGNSLKKQKSLYKVLTPSIKPPYKFLWAYGSSWCTYASLVGKGLICEWTDYRVSIFYSHI